MNATSRFIGLALAVALLAAPMACGSVEQHKLPMEDGVRLATDVYLPAGDGPWPVILMRSTYGREYPPIVERVNEGIAVVIQDVRGMGESEGDPYVFYADGWREGYRDGATTVAWIREQDWCNGKIMTFGGSALGITQMLLAPATDGLTAQDLEVMPACFYRHAVYTGGVWRKNMMENWLTLIGMPHLIEEYKKHPRFGEFWSYYDAMSRAGDITAPGLFIQGWFDIFAQGTLEGFVSREEQGGPGARGENLAILTWRAHGPESSPDYVYPESRHDLRVSHIREAFMNYHLKGDKDALAGVAKVNYFVMGADTNGAPGNEWRGADQWPPYPLNPTTLYLHPGGDLRTRAPEADAPEAAFTFDPGDPVPTHGGANLFLPSGPYCQRALGAREDVLRYVTAPLEVPLEIAGPVTVRLHVSSDAPDTDFTAKLVDVYPDGDDRELFMIEGIRRVKTRDGLDQSLPPLEGPDQVVALEIDLGPIAWVFNAGHRVGLHVSSSNYPRFEVNPNTGAEFPGGEEEMRTARNVVRHAADTPSVLILPTPAN